MCGLPSVTVEAARAGDGGDLASEPRTKGRFAVPEMMYFCGSPVNGGSGHRRPLVPPRRGLRLKTRDLVAKPYVSWIEGKLLKQ